MTYVKRAGVGDDEKWVPGRLARQNEAGKAVRQPYIAFSAVTRVRSIWQICHLSVRVLLGSPSYTAQVGAKTALLPVTSLPAMRRWFVILLAVLFSVQFGWAMAATCCTHESDEVAVSHLRHQIGTHADMPSKSLKEMNAQVGQKSICGDEMGSAELDHDHCHLAQVAVGHHVCPAFSIDSERSARHFDEPLGSSHIPACLDRPDWPRA